MLFRTKAGAALLRCLTLSKKIFSSLCLLIWLKSILTFNNRVSDEKSERRASAPGPGPAAKSAFRSSRIAASRNSVGSAQINTTAKQAGKSARIRAAEDFSMSALDSDSNGKSQKVNGSAFRTTDVKKPTFTKPTTARGRQSAASTFKAGDLIWAKFPGYPWWPAKVCKS
jgi:PWWP domain